MEEHIVQIVQHMNSIHADDLQVLQAHKYEPCTQLTQPPLSCVLQGQSPLFQTTLNGLICPSLPNSPSFLKNFTALEWTLVLFKSKNAQLNDLSALHCFTFIELAHVNAVWLNSTTTHNQVRWIYFSLNTTGDIQSRDYMPSIKKAFTWTNVSQRCIIPFVWGKIN